MAAHARPAGPSQPVWRTRARNLPREATKEDVANFFEGGSNRRTSSSSPKSARTRVGANPGGDDTRTPGVGSGEAFVELVGAEADVDEALARAGAVLGGRPAEIHRSSLEEVRRTALMGRTMI